MTFKPPTTEQQGDKMLDIFTAVFGKHLITDPAVFQVEFWKMAASAFIFYRGTACRFYHDLEVQ